MRRPSGAFGVTSPTTRASRLRSLRAVRIRPALPPMSSARNPRSIAPASTSDAARRSRPPVRSRAMSSRRPRTPSVRRVRPSMPRVQPKPRPRPTAKPLLGALKANAVLVSGTTVDTNPEVAAARARFEQAKIDLERSVIRAPVDGVVVQRAVHIGQRVQSGSALMSIVPIGEAYVDANFKERPAHQGPRRPGGRAHLRSLRLRCRLPRPCRGSRRRHRLGLRADPGTERHRQLDQGRAARARAHRDQSRTISSNIRSASVCRWKPPSTPVARPSTLASERPLR